MMNELPSSANFPKVDQEDGCPFFEKRPINRNYRTESRADLTSPADVPLTYSPEMPQNETIAISSARMKHNLLVDNEVLRYNNCANVVTAC